MKKKLLTLAIICASSLVFTSSENSQSTRKERRKIENQNRLNQELKEMEAQHAVIIAADQARQNNNTSPVEAERNAFKALGVRRK